MATAETTKIFRVIIDSSKAVDGSAAATRALANIDKAAASMETTLSRMEKGLATVGGYLKANLALAAAEFGARLVQMGKDAFQAAAGLAELAEQLGTNARSLQGMQLAAGQAGVKMEQLETGLSKFSQKMGEAADGAKDMVEALQKLGVKNLDFAGKLRPTEALLTDVAIAITAIDDPARRSAAAVDFFGKSGTRMLPLLADIAKGTDNLAAAAERLGTMIGDSTITKLDAFGDRAVVTGLKIRKEFAEGIVYVIDKLDELDAWMQGHANSANKWLVRQTEAVGDLADQARTGFDDMVVAGKRFAAGFTEALRSIPEAMGNLIFDGINAMLAKLEIGLTMIKSAWSQNAPSWLGGGGDVAAVTLGRLVGGGTTFGNRNAGIHAAEDAASAGFSPRDYTGERAQRRMIARQAGYQDDEANARIGKLGTVNAPGAGLSGIKGAGEDVRKRLDKLDLDTARQVEEANALAVASERGAKAVADLETHYKALKSVQDAYGDTAKGNEAAIAKVTARIEEQLLVAARATNLKEFTLETSQLEKANELLAAENKLFGATNEQRAIEIANIKLKQEIEKRGLNESDPKEKAAIDRRHVALEVGEREKAQAEDLKKANELWTAPLKQALQNIQTAAADAWEKILETGKLSFESLKDVFTKTLRRMAAEFLALATIRPVMSLFVQAIGGTGLISQSTISQLGYGGGGGGGILGGLIGGGSASGSASAGGGGGLFSNFGSSGIGSLLGIGDDGGMIGRGLSSLSQPLFGATYGGAGSYGSIGELISSGSEAGGSLMSGLGGAFGIGSGIFQLATGNGSAKSMVGGIGSILGGGLGLASLIPGMAGLGPIGMGVGVGAMLLSMLLGGGETPIPVQPNLDLGVGSFIPGTNGRFVSDGYGMNGGTSLGKTAGGLGAAVSGLYRQAGVRSVEGSAIGGRVWSGTDHVFNASKRDWDNRPYTQSALILPNGEQEMLNYNDSGRTIQQTADLVIAKVFAANLQRGGVSGSSATLRRAVEVDAPETQAGVSKLIDMSKEYDKLASGENLIKARRDFDAIGDSLEKIHGWADQLELDMKPIDDAYKTAVTKVKTDFITPLLDGVKTLSDPMAVTLKTLKTNRDLAMKEAEYIDKTLESSLSAVMAVNQSYDAAQKKIADDFMKPFNDAIAANDNPMKSKIDAAHKLRDADIKAADAINAVATSTDQMVDRFKVFNFYADKEQKLRDDMNKTINKSLLEDSNPLQAKIDSLNLLRDADIKDAKALNQPLKDKMQALADERDALVDSTRTGGRNQGNYTDPTNSVYGPIRDIDAAISGMLGDFVDMVKLAEVYTKKEAALKKEYYDAELSALDDVIKRLTYGDLAGLDPKALVSGTKGAYNAALAKEAADPTQKNIDDVAKISAEYVGAQRLYEGSSAEYYRIVDEVKKTLAQIDIDVRGGATSTGSSKPKAAADKTEGAAAWAIVDQQAAQIADLLLRMEANNEQMANLTSQIKRTGTYG